MFLISDNSHFNLNFNNHFNLNLWLEFSHLLLMAANANFLPVTVATPKALYYTANGANRFRFYDKTFIQVREASKSHVARFWRPCRTSAGSTIDGDGSSNSNGYILVSTNYFILVSICMHCIYSLLYSESAVSSSTLLHAE